MHKILIIDDSKTVLNQVMMLLKDSYHVFPAISGTTALKTMEHQIPDLILLDLSMPEVDRREFFGEYLDDVVSATIGGGKAVILQKVSNRRLSLKVTNQARSGKIVLVNSIGEGVSEGDFTLEYPAPVVSQAGMPSEVEMGNNLLLSGSSMNVVSAVLFTAEGGTEGNEAEESSHKVRMR